MGGRGSERSCVLEKAVPQTFLAALSGTEALQSAALRGSRSQVRAALGTRQAGRDKGRSDQYAVPAQSGEIAALQVDSPSKFFVCHRVFAAVGKAPIPRDVEVAGQARPLFADYLTDARNAWTSDVDVTPAWVREATGCSRGLSSRLAAVLSAEIVGGVTHDE